MRICKSLLLQNKPLTLICSPLYAGGMTASASTIDNRERARRLYWQGWRVSAIAKELGEKVPTVHSWKQRDEWERASAVDRIEDSLEADTCRLITLPERTRADEQRIEANLRYMERVAKIKKYQASGENKVLNPKLSSRGAKTHQQKNHLDEEQIANLKVWFNERFLRWNYQKRWWEAKNQYQIRNILKSRQIGATYYFAHEALLDALETGDNQIFLSASKLQAHIFRSYIVDTVQQVCEVELKGEHIKLSNGATLYFLATNKRSAQGYHGHLYLDEYFWIYGFAEFQRVTSGMAMHKKWRETYFSTPSSMAHEAYPFWTGEHFNEGRPKSEHIKFDLSHDVLRHGKLCEDGHWRNMVTVEDAAADGCDLFDIPALRRKYPPSTFDNLLMCKFIDDTASAFRFEEVRRGMVDSWDVWAEDFTPHATRPYGKLPVWCGYDPSRTRDDAAFVIIAPPMVGGGKFRLLEKHSWNNMPYEDQAREIFTLMERYNVEYIGIDVSGQGKGVFELIQKKFPRATPIVYGIETKNRLVLKAQAVIRARRFEFDTSHHEVVASFTSIRKSAKSGQVTYDAGRSQQTGHADLAWAIMHAFDNEPLTAALDDEEVSSTNHSFMETFDQWDSSQNLQTASLHFAVCLLMNSNSLMTSFITMHGRSSHSGIQRLSCKVVICLTIYIHGITVNIIRPQLTFGE